MYGGRRFLYRNSKNFESVEKNKFKNLDRFWDRDKIEGNENFINVFKNLKEWIGLILKINDWGRIF